MPSAPGSAPSTIQEKGYLSRWSLILRDYRRPRQLILTDGAVMSTSSLQLVEVNQTTFIQWPNSRVSPCWARVWTCLPPRLWPPGS